VKLEKELDIILVDCNVKKTKLCAQSRKGSSLSEWCCCVSTQSTRRNCLPKGNDSNSRNETALSAGTQTKPKKSSTLGRMQNQNDAYSIREGVATRDSFAEAKLKGARAFSKLHIVCDQA